MNAEQANNLRILIRHMETNVRRNLAMGYYQSCGTPGCALGEAQAIGLIPDAFREQIYCEAFGDVGSAGIFYTANHNPWRRDNVTPQEWAAEARKVLAENGYSMESDFDRFMAKVQEPVSLVAA